MSDNDYFIQTKDGERGPYTLNQLRSMWNDGRLTKVDTFRYDGTTAWIPVAKLMPQLEAAPQQHNHMPAVQINQAIATGTEGGGTANRRLLLEMKKKSGWLAAFLNFFIPGTGYMYCGRVLLGVFVLLGSILLIGLTAGVAALLIYPVVIIDGFLCAERENRKLAAELL